MKLFRYHCRFFDSLQCLRHYRQNIGFVAKINGEASHEIVERALEVLERMTHRGAESADNKTGDGAV